MERLKSSPSKMVLICRFFKKRRFPMYIKYISCALLCGLYFLILFRETMTALELKQKMANRNHLMNQLQIINNNNNNNNNEEQQNTQLVLQSISNNNNNNNNQGIKKYTNFLNQRIAISINENDDNNNNNNNNNKMQISIINLKRATSKLDNKKSNLIIIKNENKTLKKSSTKFTASTTTTNKTTTTTTTNKPSTINSIYEYSEELNAIAEHEFNQRKNKLYSVCTKNHTLSKLLPNAWEFFISPGHGLAWCNVFKAASSTWLYYFNILAGYNIGFLQRTRSSPLELARKHFPRPNQNELQDALQQSLSFLIVREPFERLLSAYRNKLEGYRNKYYKILGEQIVKKFRKNKYLKKISLTGPTFKEFLLFLIQNYKNGERFDEHWTPIYRFCTPCSINYTIIAKLETFQRDSEYIIRQTGLETLLLNKLPEKRKKSITNQSTNVTKNLIQKYFSEIDEKILNDLLEIYGPDFELFGYNITKYYDIIENNQNEFRQQKEKSIRKITSPSVTVTKTSTFGLMSPSSQSSQSSLQSSSPHSSSSSSSQSSIRKITTSIKQ